MKKNIIQMMIMVGLVACSISFAQAQTAGTYRTEIPFDFSVGTKQYTAGVYSVEVRGFEQKFFVLRDSKGRNAYMVKARSVNSTAMSGAALDFQRVGDGYILAEMRTSDSTAAFPKPRIEERLGQNKRSDTVTLALSKGK